MHVETTMDSSTDSVNAPAALTQRTGARIPEGWIIKRAGNDLIIQSPVTGPGGVMISRAEKGSLEQRLLVALAEALIGRGGAHE